MINSEVVETFSCALFTCLNKQTVHYTKRKLEYQSDVSEICASFGELKSVQSDHREDY